MPSPDKEQALKDLKTQLEENQIKLSSRHDDVSLLRFLRQKEYNVPKTVEMVVDDVKFREEWNLDAEDLIAVFSKRSSNFKVLLHYWPGAFIGTDKQGLPVMYERQGLADYGGILATIPERDMLDYHCYLQEHSRRIEQEAIRSGCPTHGMLLVQDIGGLSMKRHFLPGAFGFIRSITNMDKSHFPDLFRTIVLINVPFIFSGFWSLIKPMLDSDTQSRVELISRSPKQRLEAELDADSIPSWCGGQLEAKFPPGGDFGPFHASFQSTPITSGSGTVLSDHGEVLEPQE